jgi:hypothetical protein
MPNTPDPALSKSTNHSDHQPGAERCALTAITRTLLYGWLSTSISAGSKRPRISGADRARIRRRRAAGRAPPQRPEQRMAALRETISQNVLRANAPLQHTQEPTPSARGCLVSGARKRAAQAAACSRGN